MKWAHRSSARVYGPCGSIYGCVSCCASPGISRAKPAQSPLTLLCRRRHRRRIEAGVDGDGNHSPLSTTSRRGTSFGPHISLMILARASVSSMDDAMCGSLSRLPLKNCAGSGSPRWLRSRAGHDQRHRCRTHLVPSVTRTNSSKPRSVWSRGSEALLDWAQNNATTMPHTASARTAVILSCGARDHARATNTGAKSCVPAIRCSPRCHR